MALTDLTRISTSGIATGSTIDAAILRKDVNFRGSQVGVNSAIFDSSERELKFNDNVKLKFGDGGDLNFYHTGSHSFIDDTGTGNLYIQSNHVNIDSGGQEMANFFYGGAVQLFHSNTQRFRTTSTGAVVTGILTATSFSGPLSNASGISTFYDLRVTNNLTVEGSTTTLDTNLIGVDRVEVGANSNTVTGIAVTQSGTADIVRLYDGTSQVVTVDDEGNVGVGINSPSTKLQVHGGLVKISGHAYARVSVNDGANEGFFGFENQGPLLIGNANADAQIRVQGTNDIFFQTGNTVKRLTIKGDTGNVGIGSEIPTQKLDVTGNILTRSSTNTATFSHNALKFQTSGGAHIDHETTNQNLNFRVTKSSTSDTNMMQINAASEQTKFRKVITVGLQGGGDTTQIGGGAGIGAYLQLNYANNNIVNTKLMGNNTSWLNSHYGNLGIGTQTADHKFQVRTGTNNFISFTDAEHGSLSTLGSAIMFSRPQDGAKKICGIFQHTNQSLGIGARDDLTFHTGGNAFYYSGTERLRINSTGKTIISSPNAVAQTPVAILDVFNQGSTTQALRVYRNDLNDNTLAAFQSYHNTMGIVDKMVITSRGKVGINTDNPQRELHVKPWDNNPATAAPGYIRIEGQGADQPGILEFYHTRSNGSDKWPSSIESVDAGLTFKVATGTNGTPQTVFRITQQKEVGIGTDNPQYQFDLFNEAAASSGTSPILSIRNGYQGTADQANALKSEIRFSHRNHNSAHDFIATRIISDTTDNYMQRTFLRFLVANANNGTERLTINPYGKVGINSTSPNATLVVQEHEDNNPSIRLFRQSTGGDIASINWVTNQGNQAMINYRGTTPAGMQFYTGGTASSNLRMIINTSGRVAIGDDDPADNQLLIRAASTVGTNKGHIMLTGDSATIDQGPQIVFAESGATSSYAGGSIGFERKGGNSQGDLIFGTRGTSGDASTTTTERLRITSDGAVVIRHDGAAASDGHAGLEVRAAKNKFQLVVSSSSATASDNQARIGFKLHPSGQDERIKGAIVVQGNGGGYGQVDFMSFCLDDVGDNGNTGQIYNDERVRIMTTGFMGPIARTGSWQGTYVYRQQSQGQNYEHKIRGPKSGYIEDEMATNSVAYIKVQTLGTGTNESYCEYVWSQDGESAGANLDHIRGNSGNNSNKPYMVLDGQYPCWKTAHSVGYNFLVRVEITGGDDGETYSSTGSYAAN